MRTVTAYCTDKGIVLDVPSLDFRPAGVSADTAAEMIDAAVVMAEAELVEGGSVVGDHATVGVFYTDAERVKARDLFQ